MNEGRIGLASNDSPLSFIQEEEREMLSVVEFDDLPHTEHAHEFVGAELGDVPFSIILVHAAPGAGPRLHQHPFRYRPAHAARGGCTAGRCRS